MTIRLKDLEGALQGLSGFNNPKMELEQYVTSGHLASQFMFNAESSYGDISDKCVLDLGCGCGILSIASNLLGSAYTLGVDLDPDALEIARTNLTSLDLTDSTIEFLQANLSDPTFENIFKTRHNMKFGPLFDTVVMNPPFGTKNKGIDIRFLEVACRMSKSAVYSLHKTSTRKFVQKKAQEHGFKAEVLAEMRYDLPKTMKTHRQKTLDIAVDFWRLEKNPHKLSAS